MFTIVLRSAVIGILGLLLYAGAGALLDKFLSSTYTCMHAIANALTDDIIRIWSMFTQDSETVSYTHLTLPTILLV